MSQKVSVIENVAEFRDVENGRWLRIKGRPWKNAYFYEWPNSELATCSRCHKPKRKRLLKDAHISWHVIGKNKAGWNVTSFTDLCPGCWMVFHRLDSRLRGYECNVRLIRKIEKEIINVIKNKDNRRTA